MILKKENYGLKMMDFKFKLEDEYPQLLGEGKTINLSTLTKHASKKLNMSYKKLICIKGEEVTDQIKQRRKEISKEIVRAHLFDKTKFIYIDETGFNMQETDIYSWGLINVP